MLVQSSVFVSMKITLLTSVSTHRNLSLPIGKIPNFVTSKPHPCTYIGIVGFNVPLDTLQIITETILPTNSVTALKDDG